MAYIIRVIIQYFRDCATDVVLDIALMILLTAVVIALLLLSLGGVYLVFVPKTDSNNTIQFFHVLNFVSVG